MTKADAIQAFKSVAIIALIILCLAIPKLFLWLIGSIVTASVFRWLLKGASAAYDSR